MADYPTPHTEQAVRQAAELVRWAWIELTAGSSLSPAERSRYIAGLQTAESVVHPYQGSPRQAQIRNRSRLATTLEYGFATYHLPDRIDWQGRHFIRVPFRHRAPRSPRLAAGLSPAARHQMMSWSVYEKARYLQAGEQITAGRGGRGRVHAPGLRPYVPRLPRNIRPGYRHAAREEGMVRRAGRSKNSSTYLTFRTITPDSVGWWIPAREGVHLAARAEKETAPAVREMLAAGMMQDLRNEIAAVLRRL